MNQFNEFKSLYHSLKLSHHPFKRMMTYLNWCFKGIDFQDKSVLDIGGGNGIFSFFSRLKGASNALNLEPFTAGSSTFDFEEVNATENLSISLNNNTIQEFSTTKKFDIIILHDSINHLDETMFEKIDHNENDFIEYKKLVNKIVELLAPYGVIVITDCARRNFWGDIGLNSPFAPSIDWHLHQSPQLVKKLFEDHSFESKLRWSPFKRFGIFGYLLSSSGFLPSYFLQSHFNLMMISKK